MNRIGSCDIAEYDGVSGAWFWLLGMMDIGILGWAGFIYKIYNLDVSGVDFNTKVSPYK